MGLCCRSPRQQVRSFQLADGFPDPWPDTHAGCPAALVGRNLWSDHVIPRALPSLLVPRLWMEGLRFLLVW